MTNYYIEKDNKILLVDEDKQRLQNTITISPNFQGLEIKEVEEGYVIYDFELMTVEEMEEKQAQKERDCRNQEIDEKIKELQIMALPEVLNGNIENIKLYNNVIDGLNKAKL